MASRVKPSRARSRSSTSTKTSTTTGTSKTNTLLEQSTATENFVSLKIKNVNDVKTNIRAQVKSVLLALSRIAYVRRLCSRSEFNESTRIHFNSSIETYECFNNSSKFGSKIVKHLKGVQEAIEFRYLDEMQFVIFKDRTRTEAIETYTFSFIYAEDGSPKFFIKDLNDIMKRGQLIIGGDDKSGSYSAKEIVEKSNACFKDLMAEIQRQCQMLETLPPNACPAVRLTYNPNTPRDYHPANFMETDINLKWKDDKIPVSERLGIIPLKELASVASRRSQLDPRAKYQDNILQPLDDEELSQQGSELTQQPLSTIKHASQAQVDVEEFVEDVEDVDQTLGTSQMNGIDENGTHHDESEQFPVLAHRRPSRSRIRKSLFNTETKKRIYRDTEKLNDKDKGTKKMKPKKQRIKSSPSDTHSQ